MTAFLIEGVLYHSQFMGNLKIELVLYYLNWNTIQFMPSFTYMILPLLIQISCNLSKTIF
ncbi:hypothetical protein GIB67_032504 [Kingdonia uniflora]|uniref:Uncharacterized protein n=1 Tax=Kingdonia uniflora TaxID=39325 RepID=A0A7J7L7S6_9MAGN|nr:hypothetical protein GIB67_032504 [Kingdonia uniflora]